jgi:pimeloyl-ACP methyl ester carboxylesterase
MTTSEASHPAVFFVPGGIMPAIMSYASLLEKMGDSIRPYPKDLAIYDSEAPPTDYSLDLEVESLVRAADQANLDRFHLVGYSLGGTIALLCAEQHGQRVQSLVLFEPTVIDPAQTERILAAGPDPRQQTQMMLRPGATPPPPPPQQSGPPPPWMAKRLAAFVPIMRACRDAVPQLGSGLRRFEGRVLYALGADSNPEFFDPEKICARLPQMELETFAGCSHPNPPFRVVPDQVAQRLHAFWTVNVASASTARP